MKILILGGGPSQVNAIKRAREAGHTVIVTDYYEDAPGRAMAHYSETVSTFDIPGNIAAAKKYGVDGVLTLGTDQPVYTTARVAQELGLPSFITVSTALAVTNKRVMKTALREKGLSTAKFIFLKQDFSSAELEDFEFPLVIKPVDSQGQRGVFKLKSLEELRKYLPLSLRYSREDVILAEEFYENGEITVSGWVDEGVARIITVTDRLSFQIGPHLGISHGHRFPSRFLQSHYREIKDLTQAAAETLDITAGPIYFQFLVGNEGVKVNEVSCRLGGAYEDELLPAVTGIDILGLLLEGSLGRNLDLTLLRRYEVLDNPFTAAVPLIFARPGRIKILADTREITALPGVVQARFSVVPGQILPEISNATQRVGYMIITAADQETLRQRVQTAMAACRILDDDGNNLVISR